VGGNPDAETAAIERAVVTLRRAQRRRNLARLAERRGERTGEGARLADGVFELLDAVEEGEALTVTQAAAALGVDQPRASRLAAQALEAGLLRREADQRDGRRSLLTPTEDGRAALARIRGFRGRMVAEAMTDWPAEDRAALARLLPRFVRDFSALSDPAGRDGTD
jgi:DNA-binding MarR family transcriptional regulator